MIKYSKAFQVRVRNTKTIFHDCCKLILVSLLKEKNPNTPIYTEYNPEFPNNSYPDIYMKKKNRVYIFELQKGVTKSWMENIYNKYDLPNYDLIIIPIKDLPTEINKLIKELKKYVL